jgi:hypothetical protein
MGRWGITLLWRLAQFQEIQFWKTPFILTLPKTRTWPISTSFRYWGKMWHYILEFEMVHHRWRGSSEKVSFMATLAWLFIVTFKKPCYMSRVDPKRISRTKVVNHLVLLQVPCENLNNVALELQGAFQNIL